MPYQFQSNYAASAMGADDIGFMHEHPTEARSQRDRGLQVSLPFSVAFRASMSRLPESFGQVSHS